jgi:D-glycero-D-manno-heptose 1,7-bisphosphate phosphatase
MDRDGIINRMRPDYVKNWQEFELLPGSLEAITRLSVAGYDVIILTNQSAIARGLVRLETVQDIHERLAAVIRERGGAVRAFLICPHEPSDGCECRKPLPGLFFRARDELGVDLRRSVMIGDQMSDIEAARAAGCQAILVDPIGATSAGVDLSGCTIVQSLEQAISVILEHG